MVRKSFWLLRALQKNKGLAKWKRFLLRTMIDFLHHSTKFITLARQTKKPEHGPGLHFLGITILVSSYLYAGRTLTVATGNVPLALKPQ